MRASRTSWLVAILATGLLTGCGDQSDPAPTADPPDSAPVATPSQSPGLPVLELAGEPVVNCGEALPWPVSAMPRGVPGPLDDTEIRRLFRDALDGPASMEFEHVLPDGVGSDYRTLASTDDTVILGLGEWTARGPLDGRGWAATIRLEDGDWTISGFGDCHIEREYVEGHARVSIATAEPAGPRSVRLGILEQACTSGRDPLPHLHEPAVVETDDSVTVYLSTEPVRGGANCIGPAPTPYTLELDRPIGTRTLLDGSTYPARQVRVRE